MRKRWIIRGVLLLLGGAAITVATCIATAILMQGSRQGTAMMDNVHLPTHAASLVVAEGRWVTFLEWYTYQTPPAGHPYKSNGLVKLPAWSRLHTYEGPFVPAGTVALRSAFKEFGYGWPWRAMSVTMEELPPAVRGVPVLLDHRIIEGILLKKNTTNAYSPVVLPTRILWLGFLGNTALTVAVLLPATLGFRWLRASRRRKRGQCLACGYDLQGQRADGCPECGSGRTAIPNPTSPPSPS